MLGSGRHAEVEELRAERDAAIKRAEEATHDCDWLRITVKELRTENEKLRGELAESEADLKVHRAALRNALDGGKEWEEKARKANATIEKLRGELEAAEKAKWELRVELGKAWGVATEWTRAATARQDELATIAEKTAQEQRESMCLGFRQGQHAGEMRQLPLVTDAPSKPEPLCQHCGKTAQGGEHATSLGLGHAFDPAPPQGGKELGQPICRNCGHRRNEHFYGGTCVDVFNTYDPAPPPPESPAETRLRPCDSPGCGGHHDDE